MDMPAALRRPSQSTVVRRALVLSGLAVGLWLAGSATSSAAADDRPPSPLTSSVQHISDRAGGLLSPVTTAVAPVVVPVVEATVAPVAEALAPVRETLVRAVEPVTAPVVAVLEPVLEPVVAPVLPVLDPVLPPVVRDVVERVHAWTGVPVAAAGGSSVVATATLPSPVGVVADAALSVPAPTAEGAAARTGAVVEPFAGVLTPVPAPVPGGDHLPMPRPAVPSGAPAVASGQSSADQPAGDLPPAAAPVVLAALYAAGNAARNAAADRALDPTFAPD